MSFGSPAADFAEVGLDLNQALNATAAALILPVWQAAH